MEADWLGLHCADRWRGRMTLVLEGNLIWGSVFLVCGGCLF